MDPVTIQILLVASIPYLAWAAIKHGILAYTEWLNLKRCKRLPNNVLGIVRLLVTLKTPVDRI